MESGQIVTLLNGCYAVAISIVQDEKILGGVSPCPQNVCNETRVLGRQYARQVFSAGQMSNENLLRALGEGLGTRLVNFRVQDREGADA